MIREHDLQDPEKGQYRVHACKPVVEDFFAWLRETLRDQILLPSNPFTRAASYANRCVNILDGRILSA